MKRFISFIVIILMISACSSTKLISKHELERKNYQEIIGLNDENIPKPDIFAMYPNGLKGIYEHIENTTIYPSNAIRNKIQGSVMVEFIVETDGQVKNAKIIDSISEDLDKEALHVILVLDRFYPGFKDGKPVRVSYRLPINFKLN